MAASPTSLTLKECRKREWRAAVVERRMPHSYVTKDLFGFGDILALDTEWGTLMIQTTTTEHAPNRVQKILGECREAATDWLAHGNRIQVWGWAKRGPAGKRKLWTLKEYQITEDMLTNGEND